MSEHEIVWTHDIDMTVSEAVCNAPEGADCRLTCPQGCESWPIERDDAGAFHMVENDIIGAPDVRHDLKPCGCNVVEWLNTGGVDESRADDLAGPVEIGRIAVEPVWDDGYLWAVRSATSCRAREVIGNA